MNFFRGTLAAEGGELLFRERNGNGAPSAGMALRVAAEKSGKLDAFCGREIVMGIRPEDIADRRRTAETPPGRNVEAVAEVVEPMGAETYLHLNGGGQSFVVRAPAAECVEKNQRLSLIFDMDRAHFFDAATEKAIM
jgi:multiple sugar transport system ATP-binding protein